MAPAKTATSLSPCDNQHSPDEAGELHHHTCLAKTRHPARYIAPSAPMAADSVAVRPNRMTASTTMSGRERDHGHDSALGSRDAHLHPPKTRAKQPSEKAQPQTSVEVRGTWAGVARPVRACPSLPAPVRVGRLRALGYRRIRALRSRIQPATAERLRRPLPPSAGRREASRALPRRGRPGRGAAPWWRRRCSRPVPPRQDQKPNTAPPEQPRPARS